MAHGTVCASEFHITRDCEEIYKACKGFGTDEEKLIRILGKKNAAERQVIRENYYAMYNEDLFKRLKSELSGNLEKAMILWLYNPVERDAVIVRQALVEGSLDYKIVNEIICSRTRPHELSLICKAYYCMFKSHLEDAIAQATTGDYQTLLLALVSGQRCLCKEVDMSLVESDANKLYNAGRGRIGTDEEAIIQVLTKRSLPHLRATFACYLQIYGHDIKKAIIKETHGKFEDALRLLIKCIRWPSKYFAKVLYHSMKGINIDHDSLIRVIVTRAEVDMKEIKGVYIKKYKTSLGEAISKRCSSHYGSFLQTLLKHHETCNPI